jgi:hypothetical protein
MKTEGAVAETEPESNERTTRPKSTVEVLLILESGNLFIHDTPRYGRRITTAE